ncbi:hypothetical protein [Halalkalibacter krulwichiae]|uniref:DUF2798 domain-containing protein n=1 Tax=Halalkalibacter krulwichiae TaxID=199441 RepID=A0A1X9MFR8_9BACI|nr:hypothetical protein [Halalkalibacter krulwichiae]ARK32256.1 hypothetical protein BkAM31D_21695 [Halalkalibacter krulwichiae]
MPTTRKEKFFYGFLMVFLMVLVLTFSNLYMNGLVGIMTFKEMVMQFALVFIIAFTFFMFFISPIARKVAMMLPYDKSKKNHVIFVNSTCMVIGMILCMSIYGVGSAFVNNSLPSESLLLSYLIVYAKNFMIAYPLQLLVVGPFVRFVFAHFLKEKRGVEAA